MSIEHLAAILLLLHLISGVFIVLVIKRQWGLFKQRIDQSLRNYRRVLFTLSIVIFVGNLSPMLIDTVTILGGGGARPSQVRAISVAYAVSNAVVAVLSSLLIYILYRMAATASKKDNP